MIIRANAIHIMINQSFLPVEILELFSIETAKAAVSSAPEVSFRILKNAGHLYKRQTAFNAIIFEKKLLCLPIGKRKQGD